MREYLILITNLFLIFFSQVTQQMLRSIGTHPSRAVIGYGSNPSSPNVPNTSGVVFNFPPQRSDVDDSTTNGAPSISANGENSSPRSSGVSSKKKNTLFVVKLI